MATSCSRILLIGTGSPAASFLPIYALTLPKLIRCEVRTMLTTSGARWVSKDALDLFTAYSTLTDWPENNAQPIHTVLANWATNIIVVPATFNFCSQLAFGRSDSLAAVTVISSNVPIQIFPSLPGHVEEKDIWTEVKDRLSRSGIFVEPTETAFSFGTGKMEPGGSPAPSEVLRRIRKFITNSSEKDEIQSED